MLGGTLPNGKIVALGPSPGAFALALSGASVTLGTLTLSGSIQIGSAASGTIIGATAGSTIVGNIPGITVDSGARTYSGTPTGSAGTISDALVEALTGAVGSPKSSPITVEAATYLPAAAIAPIGGWANLKLYAGVTGDNLLATKASPASTQAIGYVGDAMDLAAATTFQGSSTLKASTLYGQVGGLNLTAPASTITTLTPNVAIGDAPQMWLGSGGPAFVSYSASRPWIIPAGVTFDRANCTIFLVCRTPGQGATVGYFMFGDSATPSFGLRSFAGGANGYTLQPIVDGVATVATSPNNKTIGICNNSVIAINSNGSRLRIWRDDQYTDFPAVSSMSQSIGGLLGSTFTINGRLDILAAEVLPAALSDADMTARMSAYKALFDTVSPATVSLFCTGDSIMFGTGGVNNRTQPAELAKQAPRTWAVRNGGIAGHFLGGPTLASGHYQDWQSSSTRFTMAGTQNILVFNYGHNDIYHYISDAGLLYTPAQTLTAMQAAVKIYCSDARTLALFDKIIIQETLPDTSGGASWTADMETARGLWNAWLATNPVDANGVICFNGVDNVATDASFVLSNAETAAGRGMTWVSQANNYGYTSDGTHPDEIGRAGTAVAGANIPGLRAAHLLAAINAAVPTPLALSYSPVVSGSQNAAYTGATPTALYGTGPFTYSIQAGTLPTGLTINTSTGVISGTPTVVQTSTGLVLRVTDSTSVHADSAAFQIAISNPQQVVVESETDSYSVTDVTSFNVNLPATVNAGELLLIPVAVDANSTLTWDQATAGTWTSLFNDAQTANRLQIYYKIADGTEDGKALAVTISAAQQVVARCFRLSGVQGSISATGTGNRGTATSFDPTAITASWGVANNFYLAIVGIDNAILITGGPTGYSTPNTRITSASGQAGLTTAYKSASGSSDDPSAFTSSTSIGYVCATVVVRPA